MHRCVLLIALLSAATVAGAEIHRWVDADGAVHFGERPPPGVESQQMELERNAPKPDPELAESRRRQERLMRVMDEEQRERDAVREQERQRKAATRRNCEIARRHLEGQRTAGYLYEEMPNGERRILSDAERAASTARAEAEVAKWCR